jgi:DnaJ-domain-containing protein 1
MCSFFFFVTMRGSIALLFSLLCCAILFQHAVAFEEYDCGEKTCYDVLELSRESTPNEIKVMYKKLSLQYHPDKTDDPADRERYAAVRQAYDTLSDPAKRAEYDNILDNPFLNWRFVCFLDLLLFYFNTHDVACCSFAKQYNSNDVRPS